MGMDVQPLVKQKEDSSVQEQRIVFAKQFVGTEFGFQSESSVMTITQIHQMGAQEYAKLNLDGNAFNLPLNVIQFVGMEFLKILKLVKI